MHATAYTASAPYYVISHIHQKHLRRFHKGFDKDSWYMRSPIPKFRKHELIISLLACRSTYSSQCLEETWCVQAEA